ncbi:MAG: signal peptidase I [Lachnospiraceae bacterium]|nr:signal peptidase I [Lachnospiraceae bacterium]
MIGQKKKPKKELELPSVECLMMEVARGETKRRIRKVVLNIVGILLVVAAIATLVATRLLILLQVNGSSMAPTLADKEMVIVYQTKNVEVGDIIGFHYGGEVLLKRVIGRGGDYIEIDPKGNVSVNGQVIEEAYLTEKSLGKCQIDFPYQVPEGMYFVLGDNRAVSMDSRIQAIGCVEELQVMGKVIIRVWPKDRMEIMH